MSTEETVIAQPAGIRTLALRESYLAICEGDACEAHLLNANQRWYEYKLKQRQQSRHANKAAAAAGEAASSDEGLWVFMSAEEWTENLLGIYNEKTVRRKLASLIERGFLMTRSNPTRKWDRKPQWLFCRAAVQAAVDGWATTRTPPDLDPSGADQVLDTPAETGEQGESRVPDDSDFKDRSTRTNVRMHSDKVPDASGQSSASTRTNVRSNTTGIFHRDLSQGSFTGGVFQLEDNAHTREAKPVDVVASSSPAPHTTGKAALQKEVGAETSAALLGRLSTPVALSPSVVMHEPPVGGAADAAQDTDLISEEDFEKLFGSQDDHATSPENVPGGAAAAAPGETAPRGASEAPVSLRVADLAPVARDELLSRPVAPMDSPQVRMIRSLVTGKRLPELLEQLTPTGALSREDWLRLTLAELEQVKRAAQSEARETSGNMITLSIAGLDRMIGAVAKAKPERPGQGNADPALVAKYDPHLTEGQRCQVGQELGVVFTVTNAHYIVDLDRQERVSINRALKAALLTLRASDAPPAAPVLGAPDDARKFAPGARWRGRKSGEDAVITGTAEVRNRAGLGLRYVLSDGARLSALDLMLGYEFQVGA